MQTTAKKARDGGRIGVPRRKALPLGLPRHWPATETSEQSDPPDQRAVSDPAQRSFTRRPACPTSAGSLRRGRSRLSSRREARSHWACSAALTAPSRRRPAPPRPSPGSAARPPPSSRLPSGFGGARLSRRGGGGGGLAGARWCGGTLCALRQDTRLGVGTRLRSALSSRKLQPWWKFESWAAVRPGPAQAREMRDGGGRGPEPLSAPVSSRGGSALGEPAGRRRRQRRRASPPSRLF